MHTSVEAACCRYPQCGTSRFSFLPSRTLIHVNLELAQIGDLDLLAAWLGCTRSQLADCVRNTRQFYNEKKVRRRRRSGRRPRVVYEVRDPLRKVQRRIALDLRRNDPTLGSHVTGFRRRSNALGNATVHCNARFVATLDLQNFFGSIGYFDVKRVFDALGVHPQLSTTLTRLTTLDGVLPQGARTSPTISNLVALRLDEAVLKRTSSLGIKYTRYADDITISGDCVPLIPEIIGWIEEAGFRVRDGARRVPAGGGQYVTGLLVDGAAPRLPPQLKRRVNHFLFFASRYGLSDAATRTHHWRDLSGDFVRIVKRTEGLISWAKSVEPETALRWSKQFQIALVASVPRKNG